MTSKGILRPYYRTAGGWLWYAVDPAGTFCRAGIRRQLGEHTRLCQYTPHMSGGVHGPLSLVIAVPAAIAAAVVFGIASVADQRSTKRVKRRRALSPRIFLDLVRQPLWVASLGGTVLGFVLQVLALRFGPLALVEPLLVLDLIFAVLISAFLRKRWDPVLLSGVVATTAGIAWFLVVAQPSSGKSSVSFSVVLPLGAGLAAAVLGCLAVAARSEQLRPLALALACGISYGVAAFLVKLVVSDVSGGLPGLLSSWPIYALAVVGPMGFLLNENAFQQGTLIAPVLSIITACDPIVSIALAALWLDETLNDTPAGMAGEVAALILMVTGIVVVAHRTPHSAPQPADAARHPPAASGPSRSWGQRPERLMSNRGGDGSLSPARRHRRRR